MINRLPYLLPAGGVQNFARFAEKIEGEQTDDSIATTYLGTPVYANLEFDADADTPENKKFILNTVLMEVDIIKNIVMTPISGRDGTVKEYINRGDYEILIQGVIVSPYANVFPKEDIVALNNLLNLPKSLVVNSSFLQVFSIHNIVVVHAKISEKMGSRNEVPFYINAVSDEPIELKELV